MITLHLHNLHFTAHHGLYDEEKLLGNEYEVNVEIHIGKSGKIDSIHQTVNYVTVYHVIKKRMMLPTQLLETLVQEIAEEVHQLDDRIRGLNMSIKKLYPPIPNFEGSVGVSFKAEY